MIPAMDFDCYIELGKHSLLLTSLLNLIAKREKKSNKENFDNFHNFLILLQYVPSSLILYNEVCTSFCSTPWVCMRDNDVTFHNVLMDSWCLNCTQKSFIWFQIGIKNISLKSRQKFNFDSDNPFRSTWF